MPDGKNNNISSNNFLVSESYSSSSSSDTASSKTPAVKRQNSPDDKSSLGNKTREKAKGSATYDIDAERQNGDNFVNTTGSLSPSPDSLNADNVSSTSRDSSSGSHSDSIKSCVSSGYDSCNSAAAVGAGIEPSSSKAPSEAVKINSLTEKEELSKTKEQELSPHEDNKKQSSSSANLNKESPPPLPCSPPPDYCPSDVPPFYVPPSGFPPPLFQKGKSISNATPLIRKLTEALSASALYLTDDTIDEDSSLSSSFENLEEEEQAVQTSVSESAILSTSTPKMSPVNASRHQDPGRQFQRRSLNSTISEEDSDNNDAPEISGSALTTSPKKDPSGFLPVARVRRKSPRVKREAPPVPPPRVMNISGPTNVSLPASVDLTSSIYKPIQKPLISVSRSQSQSPDRMAFMDPFITEPSLNRDSSPFARFLPHLSSANYDRTKNFMRRSLKSPSLSSLRQSTRSLTSSALQSLRKSSRHLKSSLLASLNKAASMDELDSPDSPRARAHAMHISAPCVPKPIGTFAYCPPSSIENVTLKSTKNKKKFSSLHQISMIERRDLDPNHLFSPNLPTSSEPSFENGNFAKLMSFNALGDPPQTQRKNRNRKVSLPDFHRSMGSLASPAGLSHSHATIQPAISQDSLNDLHVFSEAEINNITDSISRSLTTEVTRPKLTKPDGSPNNRPASSIEFSQAGELPQELESVLKSDESSTGKIVEKLTESQDLGVNSHQGKSKSGELKSAPLRKKKSSKCKPKKVDPKGNLTFECKKFVGEESTNNNVSLLPDEPSFPAPLTVPCKLAGLDSASKRHPAKPKPLLGLPIDERQIQLQQQLLQCLKIKLDEYNTNGSVSPLPPSASLVSCDSMQACGSGQGENGDYAGFKSPCQKDSLQTENEEKSKQGKCVAEVAQLKHAEEEPKVNPRGETEKIDHDLLKLENDVGEPSINSKQNKDTNIVESLETENSEKEELVSGQRRKIKELDVKHKGLHPELDASTSVEIVEGNAVGKQEDNFVDNQPTKNVEQPSKDSIRVVNGNKTNLTTNLKKGKKMSKEKGDTEDCVKNENKEEEKRRELKRLLEEKNLSLQLLREKQEIELALRKEKEELEKNQKVLEETLKQQELDRVKLETNQNSRSPEERTAEEAKKLYFKQLLDHHQHEDDECNTKLQHLPNHARNNSREKIFREKPFKSPSRVTNALTSEVETVERRPGRTLDGDSKPQMQSGINFEPATPVKNIKQQLMYHIEQRKLQQKQIPKTTQGCPKSTEVKAAEASVPVKDLEDESHGQKIPPWDDDETGDIDTNISDFIGTELVGETENCYDEQPASLTLLPPPASFCDSSFVPFDLGEKDVTNSLNNNNEILSEGSMVAPPLDCEATRLTCKTQKSKSNKRVTFGVNDTEITYYHEDKTEDDDTAQETKTHPEFNAFALRRPKSKIKRNGFLTSSSEVKDVCSVPDSPVIYENILPVEPSDEMKSSPPPPLPRKNSRSTKNKLSPSAVLQPPMPQKGRKDRSRERDDSVISDSDEVESFA